MHVRIISIYFRANNLFREAFWRVYSLNYYILSHILFHFYFETEGQKKRQVPLSAENKGRALTAAINLGMKNLCHFIFRPDSCFKPNVIHVIYGLDDRDVMVIVNAAVLPCQMCHI